MDVVKVHTGRNSHNTVYLWLTDTQAQNRYFMLENIDNRYMWIEDAGNWIDSVFSPVLSTPH